MARTESRIEESVSEIMNMITEGVYKDKFVAVSAKAFAIRVCDYWQDIARAEFEDETGEYVESVHVERLPERAFKRLPQYWVGTRHWRAHFIEYGTGPDVEGYEPRELTSGQRRGREPLTVMKATPTPEFGFADKVALRFGGTADDVASEIGSEI